MSTFGEILVRVGLFIAGGCAVVIGVMLVVITTAELVTP